MNDFKECYQSAVKDMNIPGIKEFHIDASQCMDERRHNRRIVRRMRRSAATVFSAACVVFLCGFGTVKAAEYIENVIKVKEWGFESADAATMARNEAADTRTYIVSEEVGPAPEGKGSKTAAVSIDKEEAEPEKARTLPDSGELSTEKAMEDKGAAEDIMLEEAEMDEIPVKNYSSIEEFKESEDIIFPQPSINTGVEAISATVCGDWAMIRYDVDEKVIWVERTDYANTQGHASSKVFPGGVCNERQYTTVQGYTYTLVDSVKEDGDDQLQIHGAVSVGTYEAYIDFMGYTEAEAKEIIESIDLSLYEQGKKEGK